MGFDKVKRRKTGALVTDTPFIHLDVTGVFYVFRPVVGATLAVTVTKKSASHLGGLIHDVFNVSINSSAAAVARVGLGDTVAVTVVSVSSVGALPVLLASLAAPPAAAPALPAVEEEDSGVDSENHSQGGKRGREGEEEDEADRKRQRKAAKKARRERERLDASAVAGGEGGGMALAAALGDHRRSLDFQEEGDTPAKKKRDGSPTKRVTQEHLPEGFTIEVKTKGGEGKSAGETYKMFRGPDGKVYRSLNDIQKRFVEGVSPVKSPKKANIAALKKEVKEHIVEVVNEVVERWNREESGELAEDHPRHLAFSTRQLEEMEPSSKLLWVNPVYKKREPKPKADKPKVEEVIEEEEQVQETVVEEEQEQEAEETFSRSEKKKKKKKKKKHLDDLDTTDNLEVNETTMTGTEKKKKKKRDLAEEAAFY